MGVRAQFLFSRNCLFISATGEELTLLAEQVGRRQLFRFDCHQTSVVFGKKLGAAVIGKQRGCNNRRSSWTADRDRQDRRSPQEILRSEKPFQIIAQVKWILEFDALAFSICHAESY
jgi:hypothetical protein